MPADDRSLVHLRHLPRNPYDKLRTACGVLSRRIASFADPTTCLACLGEETRRQASFPSIYIDDE